ncbi:hypothetical protein CBL_08587 [Carabus blaptoides fortunei]
MWEMYSGTSPWETTLQEEHSYRALHAATSSWFPLDGSPSGGSTKRSLCNPRGHMVTGPMTRHSIGTTRKTNKNQGGFSDAAQPIDTVRGRAGQTSDPATNLIPCGIQGCDRFFTTKTGLGVHQRSAHRRWYDANQIQNKPTKKARWSQEELSVLAQKEARITARDGKCSLRSLTEGSGRSLEAVKGQKRTKKYKDLVASFLQAQDESSSYETSTQDLNPHHPCIQATDGHSLSAVLEIPDNTPRDETDIDSSPLPTTPSPAGYRQKIVQAINTLIGESKTKINDELSLLCRRAHALTGPKMRDRLAAHIPQILPGRKRCPRKKPTNCFDDPYMSNRIRRRLMYKDTQRQWLRNPGYCIKNLLGDRPSSEGAPPKETMIPFWKNKMTMTSHSTPGYINQTTRHDSLWDPIGLEETEWCHPPIYSAMGPDGIQSKDVRKLNQVELAVLLNLLMLCDRPPESMLRSRTVLIPKKPEAKEPGDFRPLSISSVLIRCLHKILAKRVTNTIPISDKQTAFRPVDGCSTNVFLVDLALRYHRKHHKPLFMATTDIAKAYDTITHESLRDTMLQYAFPDVMVEYVMATYKYGNTSLACNGSLGLLVNAAKSHTISWKNIPKEKKCVVDEKQFFRRLMKLSSISNSYQKLVQGEIAACDKRLLDHGVQIKNKSEVNRRWAKLLHQSVDGKALRPSYIAKTNRQKGLLVIEEPHIQSPSGLNKPDLIIVKDDGAYVIDSQIINDQYDLDRAHNNKARKYKHISEEVATLTGKSQIHFGSATLSLRGVWSGCSSKQLELGMAEKKIKWTKKNFFSDKELEELFNEILLEDLPLDNNVLTDKKPDDVDEVDTNDEESILPTSFRKCISKNSGKSTATQSVTHEKQNDIEVMEVEQQSSEENNIPNTNWTERDETEASTSTTQTGIKTSWTPSNINKENTVPNMNTHSKQIVLDVELQDIENQS